MEKVQFMPEGGKRPVDFFVLEEAKLGGKQYLLVTDSEDGDGEALILRLDSGDTDPDSTYVIVEDEKELFISNHDSGVELKDIKVEVKNKKSFYSTIKLDSVSESGGNESHRRINSFSDK